MARKAFYSFHYIPDVWRVSQVRNIGKIEDNKPASDNDWETVKKGGDEAIKKWINGQLDGRSCSIVLIGSETKGRKWINYEIEKTWNDGKGLLGIYIHKLKNSDGYQSSKGGNPFDGFTVGNEKTALNTIAKSYDPPYSTSKDVYDYISSNMESWIETAISIRQKY
jgi:hypothetical protein